MITETLLKTILYILLHLVQVSEQLNDYCPLETTAESVKKGFKAYWPTTNNKKNKVNKQYETKWLLKLVSSYTRLRIWICNSDRKIKWLLKHKLPRWLEVGVVQVSEQLNDYWNFR